MEYWDEFQKKDLHFLLSATLQYHCVGPNKFVFVGVFPIPYKPQMQLI